MYGITSRFEINICHLADMNSIFIRRFLIEICIGMPPYAVMCASVDSSAGVNKILLCLIRLLALKIPQGHLTNLTFSVCVPSVDYNV